MSESLKTPPEAIKAFRDDHKLDQASLDRLFGFSSGGRATRRWEAVGAPYYVSILIAYAEEHGLDIMEQMASEREVDS